MTKVALVTGVASGIGAATAALLAKREWHVIGIDRVRSETVPGVHQYFQIDVADEQAWDGVGREIQRIHDHIDTLVNNAAIQLCKPLVDTTTAEWDEVMAVNVRSVYLACRKLYPLLATRGGSVVNVSSVHAVATSTNIAAYAASKGAVTSLTRAMAIEFARDKVRVNAVLPGAVDTAMLRSGLGRGHVTGQDVDEKLRELGRRHIAGRVGDPQEIAEAVLFLADPERSSFITGAALVVDGGAITRLSTE